MNKQIDFNLTFNIHGNELDDILDFKDGRKVVIRNIKEREGLIDLMASYLEDKKFTITLILDGKELGSI